MSGMRRLGQTGLVVLAGMGQACAVPPPPPVCDAPGVLRTVAELIQVRGQPMVLDPPAGEVSGGGGRYTPADLPPLAHCVVRGHTVAYDTNRYGASPIYAPFIVNYTVEMRQRGVFVSID
ncbi:MAG: hypothetical protein RQ966_00515 [Acetobacteraceae bacterium]|nr:hypothetical protein [Acetobacteraceae bacterium]